MLCDIGAIMADPEKRPLYDALMAVKPDYLSKNAWATLAGVNRNVFQDIKARNNATELTIQKLLAAAGVSRAEFARAMGEDEPQPAASGTVASPVSAFRHDRPRDVPVLGTPACHDLTFGNDRIETIDIDFDDVIDYVRRPPGLDGRSDVYAIYFTGYSMIPRFEPDEVGYVDPRRPPSIGDYVVVQLRGNGEDRIAAALVKRLVRRTAAYVELEQFNPPATFRLPTERIARMHRIMPLIELVGI